MQGKFLIIEWEDPVCVIKINHPHPNICQNKHFSLPGMVPFEPLFYFGKFGK